MVKRTSSFYTIKAIKGQQVRYPIVSREFTNTPIIAHFKGGTELNYPIKTLARKISNYAIKTSATTYEYAVTARVLYGAELNYSIVVKNKKQSLYPIVAKTKNVQLYPVTARVIRGTELNYPIKTSMRKTAFYPIFAREKATSLYPIVSTNYIHCKEIKRVELATSHIEHNVNMFDFVAATRRQELSSMLYNLQIAMLDASNNIKIKTTNKAFIEREINVAIKEREVATNKRNFTVEIAKKWDKATLSNIAAKTHEHSNGLVSRDLISRDNKVNTADKGSRETKLITTIISEKSNEVNSHLRTIDTSVKNYSVSTNYQDITIAENAEKITIVKSLSQAIVSADIQTSKRDIKAIVAIREMLIAAQDVYVVEKLIETYGVSLVKVAQTALNIQYKATINSNAKAIVNTEYDVITNFVNKAHDFNIKNVNIRNIAAPATNSTLATEVFYYQASDKQPTFTKVRKVDKVLLSEIDSKVAQPNNRAMHSAIEAYAKPNATHTTTPKSEIDSILLDTSAVTTKQIFESKKLDQYSAWTKQVFNLKIVDKNDVYVKKREYSTEINKQIEAVDVKNKNVRFVDAIVSEITNEKVTKTSKAVVADKNNPIATDVAEMMSSTTSPVTETDVKELVASTTGVEYTANHIKHKTMTTSYEENIRFNDKTNATNEMSTEIKIRNHSTTTTSQDINIDVLTHDTATTDKEYATELKTLSNGAVPSVIDTKLEMNNEATNSETEASLKNDAVKALIAEVDTNSNERKIERSTTDIAVEINGRDFERSLTSQDGITQITKIDRSRTEQEMFVAKKIIERGRTKQEFDASINEFERGRVTQEFETEFKRFDRAIFVTKDVNIKRFDKAMIIEKVTEISDIVGAYKPPKKKNKKKIWLHMGKSSWLPSLKNWKTR